MSERQAAPSIATLRRWQEEVGSASASEVLAWAARTFSAPVFTTSFGAEDMVVLDLISSASLPVRVATLDTGRLHEETYALMDRVHQRYGIDIEVYAPEAADVEAWQKSWGPNGFYRSIDARKACCEVRKVKPLRRALAGSNAWITGLRRAQSPTRAALPVVQLDFDHPGLVKANPLYAWSNDDVWAHLRTYDVPFNPLHNAGYPSIGCAPCTRAVQPGEDERAGRWWWESPETRECGLHVPASQLAEREAAFAPGGSGHPL